MRKKLLTLLLAVAAGVGTMFAWDYERVLIGDLYYNLDATNQTAEVTYKSYTNYKYNEGWGITTADISASVEYNSVPYTVTSIGEKAFSGCSGLTSVTIGNSVTSIGDWAFENCTGLTSVTIPNSVTSIGYEAFESCKKLASVTIGNSVTRIGWGAFYECTGLKSVTIGNSVKEIGNYAFYYCTGLKSVTIGNSVTSIGKAAFSHCSGLTSVTIPNSVTSIGEHAFLGCSGLTSVIVENGNTIYDSRDNCNAIIETATNTLIAGCKNTTIPNSVTSIGEYAFAFCYGLKSIEIPNSVTSIGKRAFYYCTGLTAIICKAVDLPTLGDEVFGNVPKNIPLYVPDGKESAYNGADQWKEFDIKPISAIPTGIEQAKSQEPIANSQKLLINGQLIILRDGKMYNVMGGEVK